MKASPKLIICGSIAIDRIMNFNGRYRDVIHPDKLQVLSLSVLLDKLEETPGGVGANIAYNAALLGEQPVLLGAVGPNASAYMQRLAELGIDTSKVHYSQLATASFNVITDMDDNQVGGFYPGAMADAKSLNLAPWQGQEILVVVSAHDPSAMARQVTEAKKYNFRLCYDPGQQVSNAPAKDLVAGLAAAEVLIVNDYELNALATKLKKTPEQLKHQIPLVITTLGREGSVIEGKELSQPLVIRSAKPAQVIDPTGAGDGYRAGFLYGYLRQWDLQICGQLGAVVASFVLEHHGTQAHHFTKAQVAQRYLQNFKQELKL